MDRAVFVNGLKGTGYLGLALVQKSHDVGLCGSIPVDDTLSDCRATLGRRPA